MITVTNEIVTPKACTHSSYRVSEVGNCQVSFSRVIFYIKISLKDHVHDSNQSHKYKAFSNNLCHSCELKPVECSLSRQKLAMIIGHWIIAEWVEGYK